MGGKGLPPSIRKFFGLEGAAAEAIDNRFIRHHGRLLHAHGVDGFLFQDNQVLDSTRYPVSHPSTLIELVASMGRPTVEEPTPAEGIP